MPETVLVLHVTAGTTALLLGPTWLLVRLRSAAGRPLAGGRRLAAGRLPAGGRPLAAGYQGAVAAVALSGAVLAVAVPGLTWLLPVAVATEALAVGGAVARRRGWRHWRTVQPHLLGGSYIALVTGLLVASTGNPVWWVLPALAGQLPIAVAKRRLSAAVPA